MEILAKELRAIYPSWCVKLQLEAGLAETRAAKTLFLAGKSTVSRRNLHFSLIFCLF